MSSLDETAGREERIDEIIARYLDARETGGGQSADEIVARHPEFEKELREFFENASFIRRVISPGYLPPCFGDDYEVFGEIGRGGMGIVYRCHQKSLDKAVAIKTIAGFAPVGNTGFVVVVQQRYEEALALDISSRNLIVWSAVVIFLAIVIIASVLWRWTRRSNAPNPA